MYYSCFRTEKIRNFEKKIIAKITHNSHSEIYGRKKIKMNKRNDKNQN